jgi:predicted RNA binding protein YcfA (HicA-like mRNA interferase family)
MTVISPCKSGVSARYSERLEHEADDLLRLLRRRAWRLGLLHEERRGKGSHLNVRHDGRPTVIPMHGGDLKTGTYYAILRQLGLRPGDLEE